MTSEAQSTEEHEADWTDGKGVLLLSLLELPQQSDPGRPGTGGPLAE